MGLYSNRKSQEKDGQVPVKPLPNEQTALVDNDKEAQGSTAPYPKSVFFIIGNEFCERFSYYGMKAILTLFLMNYLLYGRDNATMIYHIFSMACYFTPLIGAVISDSFLGKFRTIFYISIIYAAGNVVLALSAWPEIGASSAVPVAMLGLALIAFGTGGIKPCVAAFGGDQFGPGQELHLERFFSIFYISINAGSLISTFITPILRADVKCFGQECFTLAFGVPAGLMVVALILFLFGKPLYKVNPPEGNIMVKVMTCIGHALKNKFRSSEKKEHWMDHASDAFDRKLIEDIKAVLRVLFLYLPLPFFWALFDQQGSRWTIQAIFMDGRLGKNTRIQPDQMQVINPLLIVACIPLFQFLIYPALAKMRLVRTPLQKMVAGGLLAAAAFVVAFFVELALEKTMPVMPDAGYGQVNIVNGLPSHCSLNISYGTVSFVPPSNEVYFLRNVDESADPLVFNLAPSNCSTASDTKHEFRFLERKPDQAETLFIYQTPTGDIQVLQNNDSLVKPEKANSDVRIFYRDLDARSFILKYDTNDDVNMNAVSKESGSGYTKYSNIDPKIGYVLSYVGGPENKTEELKNDIEFLPGGRYIVYLEGKTFHQLKLVEENSMSLFLQIPQYIVITFGEIMFSITGLEFSYSQAPSSMKSVLQAGWLMTVAFGNLIVVLVAKFAFMKQSHEFIMFAGLMVLDMIIFAVMAYMYKPVDLSAFNEEEAPKLEEKPRLPPIESGKGQDNPAFTNDATTKM